MNVQNMTSSKGNAVPNQFMIHADDGVYFQSYETVIAFKPAPKTGGIGAFEYDAYNPVQLDRDAWDYSVTTSRYRNMFLGDNTAQVKAKIKSGEYILVDLNKG